MVNGCDSEKDWPETKLYSFWFRTAVLMVFVSGTFCGIFRRQALDRGAVLLNATKICTGHNADDMAETVLMNGELLFHGSACLGKSETGSPGGKLRYKHLFSLKIYFTYLHHIYT